MTKFKFTVEHLKKGWGVTFYVGSKSEGQKMAALIGSVSAGNGLTDKKYATALKSAGGKAYRVTFYRSKLRHITGRPGFLYDLFKQVRDQQEAAPARRSR